MKTEKRRLVIKSLMMIQPKHLLDRLILSLHPRCFSRSCTARCQRPSAVQRTLYMLTFLPCSTFLTGTPASFSRPSKPKLQPR